MDAGARYDPVAEWYDREFATTALGGSARAIAMRLLGDGAGTLLDVGCGGGSHALAFGERGWRVTGVDVSEEQLRLAMARGVEVVRADAQSLPFPGASFDAAVSMFTHTDVDDFTAVVLEVARVLREDGPFVYLGVHPCFVGPHAKFLGGEGVPELYPGYRKTKRYSEAPGISPEGLRAKVGATHIPLDSFIQSFLDAGFVLERFEEPISDRRVYPYLIALRARR